MWISEWIFQCFQDSAKLPFPDFTQSGFFGFFVWRFQYLWHSTYNSVHQSKPECLAFQNKATILEYFHAQSFLSCLELRHMPKIFWRSQCRHPSSRKLVLLWFCTSGHHQHYGFDWLFKCPESSQIYTRTHQIVEGREGQNLIILPLNQQLLPPPLFPAQFNNITTNVCRWYELIA